jgi:heme-degrading monooxygenase HmoA
MVGTLLARKENLMHPIEPAPSRRAFVTRSLRAAALVALAPASHSQERNPDMEPTIRIASDVITLVNVFTVEPQDQQGLVQVLKEGTQAFFSKQPGFISSSVLASKDGRRAINYSQWRGAKDIEAFRADPYFEPYVRRIAALGKPDTMLCDVVEVSHA